MAPTKVPQGTDRKSVVFFHPDLGIGGAERLIVDAAVGLQQLGHKVTIFTSHCDPKHCFDEARDGTLDVRVRGNTLPPSLFNRFHILLAICRQIHLILTIAVLTTELDSLKPDAFVVDQLSAGVPLLRWLYPTRQRTLFYCHFPDQLLVQNRGVGVFGIIKALYRYPFDWFEGWSTGASDKIVVNSEFTKSVAHRVFPNLNRSLDVIYPCVNVDEKRENVDEKPLWNGRYKIVLSINRFERKKDIGLAIRAYGALSAAERKSTRLIVAGGYDARIQENVQYHQELVDLAGTAGLKAATAKTVPTALAIPADIEVLFLLSVPGPFKLTLLRNARLLLYTPSNEHFGIVPVEAMQHGVPVLASNTGGPLETVLENETGWLRDVAVTDEWTAIIRLLLTDIPAERLAAISNRARQRVEDRFTRPQMARQFQQVINAMLQSPRSRFIGRQEVFAALAMVGIFLAAALAAIVQKTLSRGTDVRASEFARIRRERLESGTDGRRQRQQQQPAFNPVFPNYL